MKKYYLIPVCIYTIISIYYYFIRYYKWPDTQYEQFFFLIIYGGLLLIFSGLTSWATKKNKIRAVIIINIIFTLIIGFAYYNDYLIRDYLPAGKEAALNSADHSIDDLLHLMEDKRFRVSSFALSSLDEKIENNEITDMEYLRQRLWNKFISKNGSKDGPSLMISLIAMTDDKRIFSIFEQMRQSDRKDDLQKFGNNTLRYSFKDKGMARYYYKEYFNIDIGFIEEETLTFDTEFERDQAYKKLQKEIRNQKTPIWELPEGFEL